MNRTTESDSQERIHALDSLRAFAMFLGILLHTAMAYMTFDVGWIVRDLDASLVFDILVGSVHPFRMQLFFLVAGFFAHMLHTRLGSAGFIRHRFQRIFTPFAAGMVLLAPMVNWLWNEPLDTMAPVHLWFLEYLLIFYVAAIIVVPLAKRSSGGTLLTLNRVFSGLIRSPWKPLFLSFPAALVMWFSPMWADVDGGAGKSLVPGVRGLIYYGIFFGCGWLLHRNFDLLQELERRVWSYLFPAAPAFLVMGGLLFFESKSSHPHYHWLKLGCLIAGGLYTWLMVFGVTGLFLRYFNRPSRAIRYAADSSYWFYLMHLPLVILLQQQLAAIPWSSFTKFVMISAVTLAVLGLSYHFLVRYSFIGAILNGRRTRPTRRTESTALARAPVVLMIVLGFFGDPIIPWGEQYNKDFSRRHQQRV